MSADPQPDHRPAGPLPSGPTPSGPLVVSADPFLVDEVRRLAAAVGAVPQLVASPVAARQAWGRAPLVLVGADTAGALAALGLARRDGVHLLAASPVAAGVWRHALAVGAETIRSLPDDREVLAEALGACSDGAADGLLVCVTGACGGAGASVFAAALAATAAAGGRSALLVDADPWGGGADLLLGGEGAPGLRWPDLAATTGRVGAASLRGVLPVVDGLAVLSWGRDEPVPVPAATARAVLAAARRGHDLVVADLPRGEDDAVLEALALSSLTVLVVPAQVRAVAAARARLPQLRRSTTDLRVLVRGPGPGGLDADGVADSLDLPLLSSLRAERGLPEWLDQGFGPLRRSRGRLAGACAATLAELDRRTDRAA